MSTQVVIPPLILHESDDDFHHFDRIKNEFIRETLGAYGVKKFAQKVK